MSALDDAMAQLRALALESGVPRIEVTIYGDGRVYICGEDGPYTRWTRVADIEPGGPHPLPSVSIDGANRPGDWRPHCFDCKKPTDAGRCPVCGKTVCRQCAEKPYAFCCDAQTARDQ